VPVLVGGDDVEGYARGLYGGLDEADRLGLDVVVAVVPAPVGLGAAVAYLEGLGMDAVRAHEEEITRYALDRLIDAGATVYGPKDASARGGAVSFWFKDVHPHDLATIVNEQGIAIRAGHHCAQLVMRRYDVAATARASFYIYNTKEEVDLLADALDHAQSIFS